MYMEEKNECYGYFCQRGRNANGKVMNRASFTAGIVVLMVCLKIALLLFLVELWRAWVFLVLNIVLLAIFFTSTNPSSSQSQECKINSMGEETKEKRPNSSLCIDEVKAEKTIDQNNVAEEELQVEEKNNEPPKLSKEELNERVEAFITMFRQHLALDAKKGREYNKFYVERKQANIHGKKHFKLSSDGVNCFVLKVQG